MKTSDWSVSSPNAAASDFALIIIFIIFIYISSEPDRTRGYTAAKNRASEEPLYECRAIEGQVGCPIPLLI